MTYSATVKYLLQNFQRDVIVNNSKGGVISFVKYELSSRSNSMSKTRKIWEVINE